MNREDAGGGLDGPAHRNPLPRQIVWRQDDVLHSDFYWLSLPDGQAKAREEIRAKAEGQRIELTGPTGRRVTVNLKDGLVDLEQPIVIMANGKNSTAARAAHDRDTAGDPRNAATESICSGPGGGGSSMRWWMLWCSASVLWWPLRIFLLFQRISRCRKYRPRAGGGEMVKQVHPDWMQTEVIIYCICLRIGNRANAIR